MISIFAFGQLFQGRNTCAEEVKLAKCVNEVCDNPYEKVTKAPAVEQKLRQQTKNDETLPPRWRK